MKPLRLILTTSIAMTIVLTGCKKKETEAPAAEKPATAQQDIKIISSDEIRSLAQRPINSDHAANVSLEELKGYLGDGEVNYSDISGENGDYIIRDLTIDDEVVIKTLSVEGLHLSESETPYFDTLLIEGLTSQEFSAGRIYLNPPSYDDFLRTAHTVKEEFELEFPQTPESAEAFIGVGGGYIEDFFMQEGGFTVSMDFLGWGENQDTHEFSMSIQNLEGYVNESGLDVDFNLDAMSIENMDLTYIEGEFSENPFHYNLFKPYYDTIAIENFAIDADGFFVKIEQTQTWFTEPVNNISTGYFSSDPLTLGFERPPETEEMGVFKDAYDRLGYDIMEFYFEGETQFDYAKDITNSDNYKFIMKDGFELITSYRIEGSEQSFPKLKKIFDRYLDEDQPSPSAAETAQAFKPFNADYFAVSFTDNSIIDRSITVAAEMQGTDEALIRQQAAAATMMIAFAATTEYQGKIASEFAESLSGLIKGGGTIKMSMSQSEDLDVSGIIKNWSAAIDAGETLEFDEVLKGFNLKTEYFSKTDSIPVK